MRITNLNPDSDIGASAWLVEIDDCRLLMDAGMHPKRDGRAALPLYSLLNHKDLDAIVISHCHHDHIGSLPVAMRNYPKAHVLMTDLSYFLAGRVLHNSVNVMVRKRDEHGIRDYPLFTHDEVEGYEARFQGFKYQRDIQWGSFQKTRAGFASPDLEFFDAGHALGSAGILVRSKSQTLFYTGDVCFHDQTILAAARFQDVRADVLIMETTRGNRVPPRGFTRQGEIGRLAEAIQRVLARRGCVLMPAFALGRTQEILAQLALLMRAGKIPRQPIYIGGLGKVFTEIYDQKAHLTRRQLDGLNLSQELQLIVLDKEQLDSMKLTGGRIFVLTAGMLTECTPAHDLALRMIGDERQAVFFVGYADPDTPGGRLKASKPGDTFVFSGDAGEVTRKCEVRDFDLTAHADREALLDFVGVVSPRVILLAHGETSSRQWFEEQIRARYPAVQVIQPAPGLVVETPPPLASRPS
ncbi:MAG: MBL fold metallo-hydrolase [Verrucomicrobiota bacterium]|jgi:Cft2 family RNA processing exonuclease